MSEKIVLSSLILLSILASCTVIQDRTYLTPIPESTLYAFEEGAPIRNRLQAVTSARLMLETSRLKYEETPKVVLAERMTLFEAQQKVHESLSEEYQLGAGSEKAAWLVIFEGEFRIIPPVPETQQAPGNYAHGCVFVILEEQGPRHLGGMHCEDIVE